MQYVRFDGAVSVVAMYTEGFFMVVLFVASMLYKVKLFTLNEGKSFNKSLTG